MANISDVRPIHGQNFNTADESLAAVRAQLHQTRRELGRLRALPWQTDRTCKMISRLETRERLLTIKADALKSDAN